MPGVLQGDADFGKGAEAGAELELLEAREGMGQGKVAHVGRRAEERQVQRLLNGRAFLGVWGEEGEDALLGRVAHVAPGGGGGGGGVVEDGGEDLVVRLAGEGRAPAQEDPQHHARAPHVAENEGGGGELGEEGRGVGGGGGGGGGKGVCVPFVGVESVSDDLRGHVARRA